MDGEDYYLTAKERESRKAARAAKKAEAAEAAGLTPQQRQLREQAKMLLEMLQDADSMQDKFEQAKKMLTLLGKDIPQQAQAEGGAEGARGKAPARSSLRFQVGQPVLYIEEDGESTRPAFVRLIDRVRGNEIIDRVHHRQGARR